MRPSSGGSGILKRGVSVLRMEAAALQAQSKRMGEPFVKAVRSIAGTTGRLVVMGVGKSGLVGRKISATFSSTGTASFFVHPVEGAHGDLGMISSGDTVLAMSFSGETDELTRVLPAVKARGVTLIAMTGKANSRLARAADILLSVPVRQEACPYNLAPTTSTTLMLALGDALAMAVMELKRFKPGDFARLHPAGALGRRLHCKVRDLMHAGKNNPVILETRPVREALFVMTRTRLGAVSVVNRGGDLVGFFTDGDLRRHLQMDASTMNRRTGDVMSRSPKTVRPDQTLLEVAALFKRHSFDNVPVVDERGRPVGIVDERDLLAAGIV